MTRAFSIIELLLVVAIVSLLLGMTMPALKRVDADIRAARCLTQQHAIYVGLLSYDRDHGALPYVWQRPIDAPQRSWADSLIDTASVMYADKSGPPWLCPEQPIGTRFGGYPSVAVSTRLGYWRVSGGWEPPPVRFVSLPPGLPLLADSPPQPNWPILQEPDALWPMRAVHLDRVAWTRADGSGLR